MRYILVLCALAAAEWLNSEKEFFLGIAQGFRNEDVSGTCLTEEFQRLLEADVEAIASDYEKDAPSHNLIVHFTILAKDLGLMVQQCELAAIPVAASIAIQLEGLNAILGHALTFGSEITESIKAFQDNYDSNFYASGQALGEAFTYLFPAHQRKLKLEATKYPKYYPGDVIYNFTTGLATGLQSNNSTSECLAELQHFRQTDAYIYQLIINCTLADLSACALVLPVRAGLLKEYDLSYKLCKGPELIEGFKSLSTQDGVLNVIHNFFVNGNNKVLHRSFIDLRASFEQDNFYRAGFDLGTILRLSLGVSVS